MSPNGTKGRIFAADRFGRYQSEADIHNRVASTSSSRLTHCGHRLDRNPALQRSSAPPWCAIIGFGSSGGRQRPTQIQNDSGLGKVLREGPAHEVTLRSAVVLFRGTG